MWKYPGLRPQPSILLYLPLLISYRYVVLNTINMPMPHLSISSRDLLSELYTCISSCLLRISKLKMSQVELMRCFPKPELPAGFRGTTDGNSVLPGSQTPNRATLDFLLHTHQM